jgi:hypothetical protein
MAKITYPQQLPEDANSIKHVSIGQTRDGKDEWITPVTMWERNKSSGLYLPPGVLSDDDVAIPRVKAQLYGAKSVTREVLLDAVSVAPRSQTDYINLNITNEKKVVLLVWNDLDKLQIRSSAPWQNVASYDPTLGSLYPVPSNFSATPSHNPHVFVWVGMQYERLGLTDIKEAFDIALPPVSPSFIRVHNIDPDETLTITIRILRYWR